LRGAEPIESSDLWPCLFDKTATSPFEPHYFYQDSWAARRILATRPAQHVDVGSRVDFVAILSAAVPIVFLDIRPLAVSLTNLQCTAGSLLSLPFADASVPSLSCLHVIEHIGLGRYGDPFDPEGTRKAARELMRVLAPGGNLFIGTPIGRERVCFNAHRVHSPQTILQYFNGLELVEFSCVVGDGRFVQKADPLRTDLENGGCGLFWFTRRDGHGPTEG
jgi:SAM-dependent methyltransferase